MLIDKLPSDNKRSDDKNIDKFVKLIKNSCHIHSDVKESDKETGIEDDCQYFILGPQLKFLIFCWICRTF